jgi:hypothetical protein
MNQFPILGTDKGVIEVFNSAVKRDALRTMKNFKEGIKKNELGLIKLKDGTIQQKKKLGYSHPEIPLYAKGDESKRNSYMNMLRIRPDQKGFIVHVSKEKHWTGDIKLQYLWDIHEHGTIRTIFGGTKIYKGTKKPKKTLIRIPPRPALTKAFNMAMKQREMKKTGDIIKTALVLYIIKQKKDLLKIASNHFLKGLKKYEVLEK